MFFVSSVATARKWLSSIKFGLVGHALLSAFMSVCIEQLRPLDECYLKRHRRTKLKRGKGGSLWIRAVYFSFGPKSRGVESRSMVVIFRSASRRMSCNKNDTHDGEYLFVVCGLSIWRINLRLREVRRCYAIC